MEIKSNLVNIEVVSYSDILEPPRPLRFRGEIDGSMVVGKIIRVKDRIKEDYVGNVMYRYICEASIEEKIHIVEIKYERDTMSWFIYKPGTTQKVISS